MSYVTEHTNTNETRTQSFEILIAKARPEETSLRAVTEATEPETVAATLRRRLFTNIKGNIEGERFFANAARTALPRNTYAGPTRKNGRLPIRSESFPNVGFRQNSKRPLTPPVIYVCVLCVCVLYVRLRLDERTASILDVCAKSPLRICCVI